MCIWENNTSKFPVNIGSLFLLYLIDWRIIEGTTCEQEKFCTLERVGRSGPLQQSDKYNFIIKKYIFNNNKKINNNNSKLKLNHNHNSSILWSSICAYIINTHSFICMWCVYIRAYKISEWREEKKFLSLNNILNNKFIVSPFLFL